MVGCFSNLRVPHNGLEIFIECLMDFNAYDIYLWCFSLKIILILIVIVIENREKNRVSVQISIWVLQGGEYGGRFSIFKIDLMI